MSLGQDCRPGVRAFLGRTARNARRRGSNVANTGIVQFGDELLAMWEFGAPHRIDRDSLDTLGTNDFGGALGYLGSFSAHPKWDPATREIFNFGVDFFPTPRLRCYRITPGGAATEIAAVPLWKMAWNHDFALTQKYLVFVIDPFRPSSIKGMITARSLGDIMDYNLENSHSTVILVPRDGSKPRIIECPAMVHIHTTNAYDDGGDVVVEFIRYDSFDALKEVQAFPSYTRRGAAHADLSAAIRRWPTGSILRLRVDRSNRISEEISDPTVSLEFPQINQRYSTRRHRFSYAAATKELAAQTYNEISKYDHDTGEYTSYGFGEHGTFSIGEPIFVPRGQGGAEDDGWLLAVNHDLIDNHSRLEILDARDLESGPVATAHLTEHIPLGFHGSFHRYIARPGGFRPERTIR